MLGIILVTSTIFFVGLIHIFFSRKIRSFNDSYVLLTVFFFLTCAGIVLIIWQQYLVSEGFTRRSWPVTKATVIETEITGERASNPRISCQYQINGISYRLTTDLQTPAFGRKRSRRQTAEIIISEYPLDSELLIHYNPDQPDQACVRTGPFWDNYLILMVGLLVLFTGLLGLMNRLSRIKIRQNL